MHRDQPDIEVSTHADIAALQPIRDAWAALATASNCGLPQTYDYVACAWNVAARRPTTQLHVVSVKIGGELVLVWPLFIERLKGLRVGRHLGCGSDDEYAGPLVASDARAARAARAALQAVRPQVDVLKIYNIPPAHPLGDALREAGGLKHRTAVKSPVIEAPLTATYEEWIGRRSRSFRQGLRYDRKRLSQLGPVRFEHVSRAEAVQRVLPWIFETKRQFLTERRVAESWVFRPEGLEFFQELVGITDRVRVGALMVGDTIAGASVTFHSADLVEYYIMAYNPELQLYSPGTLLAESLAQSAFAEQSVFDFRITRDTYKLRWCDAARPYESYIVAASLRGVPSVLAQMRTHVATQSRIALKARLVKMGLWPKRGRGPAQPAAVSETAT